MPRTMRTAVMFSKHIKYKRLKPEKAYIPPQMPSSTRFRRQIVAESLIQSLWAHMRKLSEILHCGAVSAPKQYDVYMKF